ncbi:MAG: hypothetical protein QG673_1162 [Pseudomonadota bacterium]|nr:hypothetical protein [Pseudomonadota bacterium]
MIYVKIGWIPLKQFEKITSITQNAVYKRRQSVLYPEWRDGGGITKMLRDGSIHINYEAYQEWIDKQKHCPMV